MASEDFTQAVAAKLAELSGEKPTVSERELAAALAPDGGVGADELAEALVELAGASVAVQVGANADRGRMWRHSGMDEAEAQQALAREREQAERDAAAAEQAEADVEQGPALARAAEIERERGLRAGGSAGDDGEEEGALLAAAPRPDARRRASSDTQRVELPMALAGSLSSEAIAELVTTGVEQAKAAGGGFEFIVTP